MAPVARTLSWVCALAAACTTPRNDALSVADASPAGPPADGPANVVPLADGPILPLPLDAGTTPDRPRTDVAAPGKVAGATCGGGAECATGSCVDGRCCLTSSCGVCQMCLGAGGTCEVLKLAQDQDTCTGARLCDEMGRCKIDTGQACIDDASCFLGHCSQGTCCNTACNAGCQTCGPDTHGFCQTIRGMADPATCAIPGGTCDSDGTCVAADQIQRVGADAESGTMLGPGADAAIAQVFTAGVAGSLADVSLALDCVGDPYVGIAIEGVTAQGLPDGQAQSSIPEYVIGSFPAGERFNGFHLEFAVSQSVGDRRAIVITGPTTGGCLARSAGGNPYPPGKAFRRPMGSSAWVEIAGDFTFQTYVQPN